jgi:queuine tRNA-ribosyltransferase
MLGVRLNTLHNLHYILTLMAELREAIQGGSFSEFRDRFYATREACRT